MKFDNLDWITKAKNTEIHAEVTQIPMHEYVIWA